MPTDFEKAKQEQEIKRKLWRQQQKARMQRHLPGGLSTNNQNKKEIEEKEVEDNEEFPSGMSFEAITARLRKQKLEKLRKGENKKGKMSKIAEAKKKVEDVKEAAKNLKNIYRIINGVSAVSLAGLIITFLVMNAQLILGNWLKVKLVPELSFPEILIIIFIDFMIFIALLILFLLICFIIAIIMQHPVIKIIKMVT